MENYAGIKARLALNAKTAVIGLDDGWCYDVATTRVRQEQEQAKKRRQATYGISVIDDDAPGFDGGEQVIRAAKAMDAGMTVLNAEAAGEIYRYDDGPQVKILADLANAMTLRGGHNAQNAAAAVAILMELSLMELGVLASSRAESGASTSTAPDSQSQTKLTEALASFPGLAHRMEILGHRGKVLFVNDSKGTNADAAQKALASFDDIYWIAGGLSKEGGIEPLIDFFPRIAKAYLIGAAADDFAATLEGKVAYEQCATLDVAIARAAADAAKSQSDEPVILLSPACASFDQFPSFTVRGDEFRKLAGALPGMVLTARAES